MADGAAVGSGAPQVWGSPVPIETALPRDGALADPGQAIGPPLRGEYRTEMYASVGPAALAWLHVGCSPPCLRSVRGEAGGTNDHAIPECIARRARRSARAGCV